MREEKRTSGRERGREGWEGREIGWERGRERRRDAARGGFFFTVAFYRRLQQPEGAWPADCLLIDMRRSGGTNEENIGVSGSNASWETANDGRPPLAPMTTAHSCA